MTSTGKRARKRYGNRFAAKARREPGLKRKKSRKVFGTLPFSVLKGNALSVVSANWNATERVRLAREKRGYAADANVAA